MSALDKLLDTNLTKLHLKDDFSEIAARFFESSVRSYLTQAMLDLDNRM